MLSTIHKDWRPLINSILREPNFNSFFKNLQTNTDYLPDYKNVFKVFEQPIENIKVVILGVQPYPIPKINTGLAYAVNKNNKPTTLLNNILYCVLKDYINNKIDHKHYEIIENTEWKTLKHLENQGVFLLNVCLTVENDNNEINTSEHNKYWKYFTSKIIQYLSIKKPCIWLIWGDFLIKYNQYILNKIFVNKYNENTFENIPISNQYNYIIENVFPNEKIKFYEKKNFKKTNKILKKLRKKEIIWYN